MDDLKSHIEKLREDFMKGMLTEKACSDDPFTQFNLWLREAVDAAIPEVQAMNLSTVSVDHKPSSRIVYLREFEDHNFSFYTNYNSRKAQQLVANPNAALTFFWPELERQIRIEGIVEKLSATRSDRYFNERPFESKIGAWASMQSTTLVSREELEEKVQQYKMQFSPDTIVRPDFWGGYQLKAHYYEFWQGRKSRLHDRLNYQLNNENVWIKGRIAP